MDKTIEKYIYEILQQAEAENCHSHDIYELVSPDEPIILYGAGQCLSSFNMTVLEKYPLNITAILDENAKCGQLWNGIPVRTPAEYKIPDNLKTAIITIGKNEYLSSVRELLTQMGVDNIIFAKDIYQFYTMIVPEEMEREKHFYFRKNISRIIKAGLMLHDAESIEIFLKILEIYILRIPQDIPCRAAETQYFPEDLFDLRSYQNIVHCGGYHGETILQMNKIFGKVNSLICIEGDINNYSVMQKNLFPYRKNIADEMILLPVFVSNDISTAQFKSDGIVSRKSAAGNLILPAIPLDYLLSNYIPTYITMDIEGEEMEALDGCRNIIKDHKPDMAISIYHNPTHLWEIMLKIYEYCPEYTFAIRNYTGGVSDTILYACSPDNRKA